VRVQVYTLGRSAGSARLSTISSFFLRRELASLLVLRAFSIFLQENHRSSPFCTGTPGSQFWSGIDFPSTDRKLFTCHSRHSVDLRPMSVGLKVRELPLNSSANVLNGRKIRIVVLKRSSTVLGDLRFILWGMLLSVRQAAMRSLGVILNEGSGAHAFPLGISQRNVVGGVAALTAAARSDRPGFWPNGVRSRS
jgi:hypothetical protein